VIAMSLHTTAPQTVGPYLHIGLDWLVTDNPVDAVVHAKTRPSC
jgi:hypothetical protein